MLDIQFIRDNPELVQKKSEEKGYKNVDVAALIAIDAKRRELLVAVEDLRAQRNKLNDAMKGGRPSAEQIEQGKQLKEEIAAKEAELATVEAEFIDAMWTVPNVTLDDVPLGGEEDSVEIKAWGEKREKAADHLDVATAHDWVDFERGTKVAGAKFYYVKGDLALLENAITQYALSVVTKKGFTFMYVPHMVNSRTMTGTGFAPRTSDQSDEYNIEGEDLSLIATAEISLTGLHTDEIIDEKDLPLKYAGLSPCYRKEAEIGRASCRERV